MMIPLVCLLEYRENNTLDLEVTRFVNDQIIQMIDFITDMEKIISDDDDGYTSDCNVYKIVPEGCFRDKNFSYEVKLQEIRDLLSSYILRKNSLELSPLNQYIIYRLIEVFIEIYPDYEVIVDDELQKKILSCKSYYTIDDTGKVCNYVLESICDYNTYRDFLFYDLDFQEEIATFYVMAPVETGQLDVNSRIEAEQYLPLVPDDVAEKYRVACQQDEGTHRLKEESKTVYISGDKNVIFSNNNVQNSAVDFNQDDSTDQRDIKEKSWWERYGITSIVVAILSAISVIIAAVLQNR